MKLKLLNYLGINIMYVCDINNYLYLSDLSVLNQINFDEDISADDFLHFIERNYPEKLAEITHNINAIKNLNRKEQVNNEYTICIHPSRKCNLRCKYCFGEESYLPCNEISIDTAIKAIDYIVLNYGKQGSMYTIDLSGSGEPLLRFDFLKSLDEYCDSLRNKTGKQILIKFATNATLVTDEIADYLHNSKCIIFGVSIDGNENQNGNRIYKNGNPIYNDLINGINKINNELLGLAVTITHLNENVDELYSNLYSLNVSAISMHFVRDYTDSDTSLYKINMNNLLIHYDKLISSFIEHIKSGDLEYIMPLIRGDDFFGVLITKTFFTGNIPKNRCPAGRSKFAVDENGDLYACSVMNGNKEFYVGNIVNGIDKEKQTKFIYSNIEMSEKCRECWCKNICAGECMANSFIQSNTLYKPNDFLCELKYQLIPKAIAFVEYLRINYINAYNLIKSFILSSAVYSNSDTATWAILKYLQSTNYNVSYLEISRALSKMNKSLEAYFDRGIHPKFVEQYLSSFNDNVFTACVDDISSIIGINKFPIISYLNKIGSLYHQYVLIESLDDNLVRYKTLKSDEPLSMNTKEFLRCYSNVFIGDL